MPFTEPEPMGSLAHIWVAIYVLVSVFMGIVDGWGRNGKRNGANQKPYWGHHYQRRRARDLWRK